MAACGFLKRQIAIEYVKDAEPEPEKVSPM
jgi:hypothetical protein